MFGLSGQTTKTWSQPAGGDELVVHQSNGSVVRFEPYLEIATPPPVGEWRCEEALWAAIASADAFADFDHDADHHELDDEDPDVHF